MFFNEAEVLGVHAQAAVQEELGSDGDGKDGDAPAAAIQWD